jgi:hypothetical protein
VGCCLSTASVPAGLMLCVLLVAGCCGAQ